MSRQLTSIEFISKAKLLHGNKYDYSMCIYEKSLLKIIIGCHIHGKFYQTPNNHLSGKGCPSCKLDYLSRIKSRTKEDFINIAKQMYGDRYLYEFVDYVNSKHKIEIICPSHGKFYQIPNDHLSGHGCPTCHHRISKSEIKFLDYVGICHNNTQKYIKPYKVDGYDPKTNTIYEYLGDYYHGNPEIFDSNDYNQKCKKSYGELYQITLGKLTTLKQRGYIVKYIWETDWNKFEKCIDIVPNIIEHNFI